MSDEDHVGGRILFISFASSFELESKEYFIYDFPRITAAVGGAMGLFLGVSLIQAIIYLIDWVGGRAYKVEGGAQNVLIKVGPAKKEMF